LGAISGVWGSFEEKEWNDTRHSKSGNNTFITRREGRGFVVVEMTKHERIISIFEIGSCRAGRDAKWRNRIEGGNGKRSWNAAALAGGANQPETGGKASKPSQCKAEKTPGLK
jgi:hypothetical protein